MATPLIFCLRDYYNMGYRGLICTEAALGYWGLTSYDYYTFPIFMVQVPEPLWVTGNVNILGITEPMDYTDAVELPKFPGVFVSSKINSVLDMLRYDSCLFHTIEGIQGFYDYEPYEEIAKLEERAKAAGLYDKLIEMRDVDTSEDG